VSIIDGVKSSKIIDVVSNIPLFGVLLFHIVAHVVAGAV